MKKKLIGLIAVLMVAGSASVFAFGIGLQFNNNAGEVFAPGVALTFKADSIPLVFAANWNFQETVQTFGITGDYWVLNRPLTNIGNATLNWYFGVGFFANLTLVQDADAQFAGGMRIPLGLNMFVADGFFEPYIQIAPSFGIRFVPSLGTENLFWPMSLGFRMWFK